MSVYPKIWLVVAPLAFVSSARAQESAVTSAPVAPTPSLPAISPSLANEPEVSLEALIQRALQSNPQLPIARENLEAARQRAAGARSLLNPTLQAVPRILGNHTAAETEVIVSQPLDVFGRRRAQAQVFAANVRGAEAQNTLAQRSLIVQVKNAVANLFAAQEAENLGTSQVQVAELFRQAASRRATEGDVPAVQVQRANLELARVQNELTAARAERLARRAALNQLVGQAPETPLRVALPVSTDFAAVLQVPNSAQTGSGSLGTPQTGALGAESGAVGNALSGGGSLSGNTIGATDRVPSVPPSANPAAPTPAISNGSGIGGNAILGASSQLGSDLVAQRSALLPGALTRPDIVGAQATLEARQAQVRALSRQRYPDVELQVRRGSFFGQGSSSTALRAVITVPIFDFGSISREKKAVQAEVRAQQSQVALLRQQAATQVEQALIRLEQQRQTVSQYRQVIVPQTLDLLRKTHTGYAQGASTYLEVLDAQRTVRQVQTEYLQALVGTRTSEAALESALGATPPDNLTGSIANPSGASALPGTAVPGTVPEDTIPANPTQPLNPPSSNLPGTNAPIGQGLTPDLPPSPNR